MERGMRRYSEAFKMQVVQEIESGGLNYHQARMKYGIGGGSTIAEWVREMGKVHLLNQVIRIETMDERDRLKELEQEKKRLESALAQEHLKVMALEELIKVAEVHYRIDIKKNSGSRPLDSSKDKPV